MRIITGTFAVFWKRARKDTVQFHADVKADTAADAARIFAALYPGDTICSVRGPNGRFANYS